MKKTVAIAFIALLVSFGFISCYDNTDFLTESEKNTQYLINAKNGWRLVAASSTPIYDATGGNTKNDLLKSFLEEWDLDDIVYYKGDNEMYVRPDTALPPEGALGYTVYTMMGAWSIEGEEGTSLKTHLPFLHTKGRNTAVTATITSISSTVFSFNCTYVENKDEPTAKEYQFSLTYRANP